VTFTIPFDAPTIALMLFGSILGVNLLLWVIFIMYAKFGSLRPHLQAIIGWVDNYCDDYEDPEKRKVAVANINELLGWRKIFIPTFLIGWAVDAEVYYLHKICPDVHTAAIQQITAEGVQAVEQITAAGVQAVKDASKEAKP